MVRNGHSVITGMGVHESAIWIHDGRGERFLSSEGEIDAYVRTTVHRNLYRVLLP